MIDVKNLYENDGWWIDYQPMINAFGNVAIQVKDDDYSGDTRVLYDNGSEIGHLVFGWGSCSGCDALQACDDYEELQELCNELQSKIIWFSNAKETLEWFTTRDWELQWDWHEEETQKYIDMAKKYLSKKAGE
jgi:hypothetical protein